MYDDVNNQQRTVIYGQRREVLDGLDLKAKILSMLEDTIRVSVESYCSSEFPDEWNFASLRAEYMGIITTEDDFHYDQVALNELDREEFVTMLTDRAKALYEEKERLFGSETFREVERAVLLRNVDTKWMDHIDAMSDLMGSIGLQAYAQHNPITEYKLVGADMFDEMIDAIKRDTVMMILRVFPKTDKIERVQVAHETGASVSDGSAKKQPIRKTAAQKVGRNDPCPCGSGKKYKKCCGSQSGDIGEE